MEKKRNTKGIKKGSTRKRKKSNWLHGCMVILLLFLAGIGLYASGVFSLGGSGENKEHREVPKGVIENKNADFTDASTVIQQILHDKLEKETDRWETGEVEKRSTPREHTGGTITWTTGNYFFQPTNVFKEDILKSKLEQIDRDLSVYKVESDTWKNEKVLRYDIAMKEPLDGMDIYLVVARIYVGKAVLKSEIPKENKAASVERKRISSDKKAKLAIVLDDFGYGEGQLSTFNNMSIPLTYAVLPNKPYSREAAISGHNHGKHIILHLPMQPLNTESSEPVHIRVDMTEQDIIQTTSELLNSIPYVQGANNHQGSRATSDRKTMYPVLQVLKGRGYYFVDSRTTSASVAGQTARTLGVPTISNELFIDNDSAVEAIKERLQEGANIAFRDGYAVIIGHDRPNTAAALKAMIPVLEQQGIEFVFVSDVLQ